MANNTLDLDRYIEATSDVHVVIRGTRYQAPPMSVRQVTAYHAKLKDLVADDDSELAVLEVQKEALRVRLRDPDGQPIDPEILEDLPADAVSATFSFFSIASTSQKKRKSLPEATQGMLAEAEAELTPYMAAADSLTSS